MNNASDMKIRKTHVKWTTFLFLFIMMPIFGYQSMRLNGKIERLEDEIQTLEDSTAKIRKTLPALRKVSKQVLTDVLPELVPQENTAEWSEYLVNFPYLQENFKCTHSIPEPENPIQMELGDFEEQLYPATVPFQIDVNVDGTLSQISYFVGEINRQYHKMHISKIDLRADDKNETLKGRLTLSFPQIQHPEGIDEIRRFVEKEPS